MSNKKRIHKRQKSITSYKQAKVWECIALALKVVNNAMYLQREKLRASQISKNNFPSGIIISKEQEKILSGGWKNNPILHPGYDEEKKIADAWVEYIKKSNDRIQVEIPKQLEEIIALVKAANS